MVFMPKLVLTWVFSHQVLDFPYLIVFIKSKSCQNKILQILWTWLPSFTHFPNWDWNRDHRSKLGPKDRVVTSTITLSNAMPKKNNLISTWPHFDSTRACSSFFSPKQNIKSHFFISTWPSYFCLVEIRDCSSLFAIQTLLHSQRKNTSTQHTSQHGHKQFNTLPNMVTNNSVFLFQHILSFLTPKN